LRPGSRAGLTRSLRHPANPLYSLLIRRIPRNLDQASPRGQILKRSRLSPEIRCATVVPPDRRSSTENDAERLIVLRRSSKHILPAQRNAADPPAPPAGNEVLPSADRPGQQPTPNKCRAFTIPSSPHLVHYVLLTGARAGRTKPAPHPCCPHAPSAPGHRTISAAYSADQRALHPGLVMSRLPKDSRKIRADRRRRAASYPYASLPQVLMCVLPLPSLISSSSQFLVVSRAQSVLQSTRAESALRCPCARPLFRR